LNQYTARTNSHYLSVEGTSTNATVKVYETGSSEVAATRKDDYFFRDWNPSGTTASDYPEINVKEGTTVTSTGNAWIPKTTETPITYDFNGNLTQDALWVYTYDHENRLIKMEETTGTGSAAAAGFPDTTITFLYDYLGRRVEKKVMRGATTESKLRFVWQGWMLVAELDDKTNNNTLAKTYIWGPDISGSFGGAGGNGGVLLVKDHVVNEMFYPAYDMQGNVYGLIDMSGNLDAAYEYDPFGKLIRSSGTRKNSMSLLYGTKYTDMETGLIYYGHRYYDPNQGRFINRDPSGESGGINLYGMVRNNLVNAVDFLGLNYTDLINSDISSDDDEEEYYDDDIFGLEGFEVMEDINYAQEDFDDMMLEQRLREIDEREFYEATGIELELWEFYESDEGGNSPGNGDDRPIENKEDNCATTAFAGLGANAALVLGFDRNVDLAVSWGPEAKDWDIGIIQSTAVSGGIIGGLDIHGGMAEGNVQDQKGYYSYVSGSGTGAWGTGAFNAEESFGAALVNVGKFLTADDSTEYSGSFITFSPGTSSPGATIGVGHANPDSVQGLLGSLKDFGDSANKMLKDFYGNKGIYEKCAK
jgi:RHS repeat-associated protein